MNKNESIKLIFDILENKIIPKNVSPERKELAQRQVSQLQNNGVNIIGIEQFVYNIKNSNNYKYLVNSIKNIKTEYVFDSDIHGLNHSLKVLLMGYYICLEEKLSDKEMQIMIPAFLYHDIGRINNSEDNMHGQRSAEIIDKVVEGLTCEDIKVLKALCEYHCLPDVEDSFYFDNFEYNSKSIVKLLNILKDADALDRVRIIEPWGLDIKYLRTQASKTLVKVAYLLNYVFTNWRN